MVFITSLRDGNALVVDDVGLELPDVRSAQREAARALAGVAWDAMRVDGAQGQQMKIEVRDAQGPVMEVRLRSHESIKAAEC